MMFHLLVYTINIMTHIWLGYYALRRLLGIDPTIEAVDLGLSVKWGSMNLGAHTNYEYGTQYMWGQSPTGRPQKAYHVDPKRGKLDYLTTLLPRDDMAYLRLGRGWRTPTLEEWEELLNRCTIQKCMINRAIEALLVTGPSGKQILFAIHDIPYFWSSCIDKFDEVYVFYFNTWGDKNYFRRKLRNELGFIRPVYCL